MTFKEWAEKVEKILSHTAYSFSEYQLKQCYRDGMEPKEAVRWLLGY